MRSKSGMFVAPERRMSSEVITKIAAAARETFCSCFETEVTLMFIRSSRLSFARSLGGFCGHAEIAASAANAKTKHARRGTLRIFRLQFSGGKRQKNTTPPNCDRKRPDAVNCELLFR